MLADRMLSMNIPKIVLVTALWAAMAQPLWTVAAAPPADHALQSLQLAINDLIETYGAKYPQGSNYLARLAAVEPAVRSGAAGAWQQFEALQREALLANPALNFDKLLVVRRRQIKPVEKSPDEWKWEWPKSFAGKELGLPSNHECNQSVPKLGWDNEIATLSLKDPAAGCTTVFRPPDGGWVGEIRLHWDGRRLLFTRADAANWKLWEIKADGSGLRQVSRMPADVDCMDPCYLPDGGVVFGSTAPIQAVPCWHGLRRVTNLYRMNADGTDAQQLCFDQDHDLHPFVLPDGQVLYNRWEYSAVGHAFQRTLMVMNPDGSGQRSIYGGNSYFPNGKYYAKPLPGNPNRIVLILAGYHGPYRMGQLGVLDTTRGFSEADGLVCRISGCGAPICRKVRDNLVGDDWPKFLHPWPVTDKQFLVAGWPSPAAAWGIYLADIFDNLVLLHAEPGYALLEPVPLGPQPVPAVIPKHVAPERSDALVYIHDLYEGRGLAGVPRGTVQNLRLFAYDFGYPGLAGPDKIGVFGPWEVMRLLGTVPVEADGSAFFRVPANTPIAVQTLDAEGQAVQLMRNWFTAKPDETVSCVGCHETPDVTVKPRVALAAQRAPRELTPWHGPVRGFDFAREVQPVLDRDCVRCHDGGATAAPPDLRPKAQRPDYTGRLLCGLSLARLHPAMKTATGGWLKYTPAYEALRNYVRVPAIEDDVHVLVPGEFYANTSPLIQMLRKGHHGVRLDHEAMDRLVTWIDLNAPCYGTWGEVFPIPDEVHARRLELRKLYGGPTTDPETTATLLPAVLQTASASIQKNPKPEVHNAQSQLSKPAGWPLTPDQARLLQAAAPVRERTLDLGAGVTMRLVWVPPGEFVMGDPAGPEDEQPPTAVAVRRGFWMGACEVNNEQFRRFDPAHDSRYYAKRHAREDDEGLTLNDPHQPVVRVAWTHALDFCRWLSARTGMKVTLPTEAQWEYACRAGSATPLNYGTVEADFSLWANVGDAAFAGVSPWGQFKRITAGLDHVLIEGGALVDARFSDHAVVTASVGSYRPNAWGLFDMHGNAAEWTLSDYRPYPYRDDDGRNTVTSSGDKVVRGGSFFDAPKHCRSASRCAYPVWQRVFNVGFRVIGEAPAQVIAVNHAAQGLSR